MVRLKMGTHVRAVASLRIHTAIKMGHGRDYNRGEIAQLCVPVRVMNRIHSKDLISYFAKDNARIADDAFCPSPNICASSLAPSLRSHLAMTSVINKRNRIQYRNCVSARIAEYMRTRLALTESRAESTTVIYTHCTKNCCGGGRLSYKSRTRLIRRSTADSSSPPPPPPPLSRPGVGAHPRHR